MRCGSGSRRFARCSRAKALDSRRAAGRASDPGERNTRPKSGRSRARDLFALEPGDTRRTESSAGRPEGTHSSPAKLSAREAGSFGSSRSARPHSPRQGKSRHPGRARRSRPVSKLVRSPRQCRLRNSRWPFPLKRCHFGPGRGPLHHPSDSPNVLRRPICHVETHHRPQHQRPRAPARWWRAPGPFRPPPGGSCWPKPLAAWPEQSSPARFPRQPRRARLKIRPPTVDIPGPFRSDFQRPFPTPRHGRGLPLLPLSSWVRERLRRVAGSELEHANLPVPFVKSRI